MGQQDAACDARHVFDAATQMGAQGVCEAGAGAGGGGGGGGSIVQRSKQPT